MDDTVANDEGLRAKLVLLRQEHADLGDAIDALSAKPDADQLQIARLKKKKLALRDEIVRVSGQTTPDIIA